jgi:hypothetical protein
MYDNVYFFNTANNGDIHLSRNFVKYCSNLIEAKNYFFVHQKNKKITYDLKPKILTLNKDLNNLKHKLVYKENNDVYINTWIGNAERGYAAENTIDHNVYYNMFQKAMNILNIPFSPEPEEVLPDIDFNKYNFNFKETFSDLKNTKNILFCNNNFLSGQSFEINMDDILEVLTDKYKEYNFIITNETNLRKKNINYLYDYFHYDDSGSDLIECSYISLFCEHIIGRNSGPHSLTYTKSNLLDSTKKIHCLTKFENICYWYEYRKCVITWYSNIEDFKKINLESK